MSRHANSVMTCILEVETSSRYTAVKFKIPENIKKREELPKRIAVEQTDIPHNVSSGSFVED